MSDAPNVHNHHHVYILGAGYSRDAGFPLIADFMQRMREAHEWLEAQPGRAREAEAIKRVLRFRLRAAGASYRTRFDAENIEELFSLASAEGDAELERSMGLAIAATLDFAATCPQASKVGAYFNFECAPTELPPSWRPKSLNGSDTQAQCRWSLYEAYAALLAGQLHATGGRHANTVISFNYDLLVEDGLRSLGLPFSYEFAPGSVQWAKDVWAEPKASEADLRLLKLHGSVNWTADTLVTIHSTYGAARRSSGDPLIVPPTWRRKYGIAPQGGVLTHVWEQAIRALREATTITVIGYSLPATDVHFRYLLGAGLRENISLRLIELVNPRCTEEFKARVAAVFPAELLQREVLVFRPNGLSDYVFAHERWIDHLRQRRYSYGTRYDLSGGAGGLEA